MTHPKINSVAALLRLPVGTKLRIIRTAHNGPCSSGRIVHEVRSRDIGMLIDDTTAARNGEVSWLTLKGAKVEARDNGFAVLNDGEVTVEYEFAPADSTSA